MTEIERGVHAADMAIYALDVTYTLDWLDDDGYEHDADYGADRRQPWTPLAAS
jgi:hypothetical protein